MGTISKSSLIDLVNSENTKKLVPTDVTVSNPTEVADDRSDVTLTGNGRYRGSVSVNYRRLGLDHLFACFVPRILVNPEENPLSPAEVVARVRERFPITLEVDELDIVHEAREDGDYYTVTAKDNSLVYKASVVLGTRPKVQAPISNVVIPTSASYVYPLPDTERAYARIYSGGWAVPECTAELSELLVGSLADVNLTWLVNILSGDDWALTAEPSEYNLQDAMVTYNGPVSGIDLMPDEGITLYSYPNYDHVLLLELSDVLCTGLVGKLTLYYGAENVVN